MWTIGQTKCCSRKRTQVTSDWDSALGIILQVFDQQPLIVKQLKTQWAFDFLLVGNLNLSVVSGLWCGPLHGSRSGVSHQEHGFAWQVSFAWSGLFKLMLRQTSFPILVFINQARIAWMFKNVLLCKDKSSGGWLKPENIFNQKHPDWSRIGWLVFDRQCSVTGVECWLTGVWLEGFFSWEVSAPTPFVFGILSHSDRFRW